MLEQPSTVVDVARFFTSFARHDVVGRVALQHLRVADLCGTMPATPADHARRPRGWADPECLRLSELHNAAVDFGKVHCG